MIDYLKATVGGVLVGGAICAAIMLGDTGCGALSGGSGAESPQRSTARAINLTVAKAVVVGDQTCATFATQIKDVKLAKGCADAYDVARPVLLSTEASLDVWDAVAQDQVGCAINGGVSALTQISALLLSQKVAVPSVILDALKLVSSVSFSCKSQPVVVPSLPESVDAGNGITVVYPVDGGK